MEARPPKRRKLHRLYDKQLQAQAGLVQQARALLAEELPVDSSPEPVVATVVGEGPGELDDGAWLDQLPNDTLAALQLLRAQFPAKLLNKAQPFMLRSQVYSLLKDHTTADRELDILRLQHEARMFKLPSTVDDYAFMFAADYRRAVGVQLAALQEKGGMDAERLRVFDWFAERVLPRHREVGIGHAQLLQLLTTDARGRPTGDAAGEAHVSLLLHMGLLTRSLADAQGYVFGMGGGGALVSHIVRGRKELLGLIMRKRYREASMKEVAKKRLRASELGIQWHVRDLIGRGLVMSVVSTSGPLLRAAVKNGTR